MNGDRDASPAAVPAAGQPADRSDHPGGYGVGADDGAKVLRLPGQRDDDPQRPEGERSG